MMNEYNTPLGKYDRVLGNGTNWIDVWKVNKEGVWFNYPNGTTRRSEAQYFNWGYFNQTFKPNHVTPKDEFMETDF